MANKNLCINLIPRQDVDGNIFYVGKLKVDATLNFKRGCAFLVFVSEEGTEQLQISMMDDKQED